MSYREKKAEPIPPQKGDTARHEIAAVISERPHTANEISRLAGVSEKDVYAHLEHIKKSYAADKGGGVFEMEPPRCIECGFEFKKRERLKKPGKCPACKGERIEEPVFFISKRS